MDLGALKDLGGHIETSLENEVKKCTVAAGELTVLARADQIVAVLTFLRDEQQCRIDRVSPF